jgi:hypothetical protein
MQHRALSINVASPVTLLRNGYVNGTAGNVIELVPHIHHTPKQNNVFEICNIKKFLISSGHGNIGSSGFAMLMESALVFKGKHKITTLHARACVCVQSKTKQSRAREYLFHIIDGYIVFISPKLPFFVIILSKIYG